MSRYRFVEAESRWYSVTQLCRIAQVSRSAIVGQTFPTLYRLGVPARTLARFYGDPR